jgi:hypothetical protein
VILRDGVNIRGINAAVTIWCTASHDASGSLAYRLRVMVAHRLRRIEVVRGIDGQPSYVVQSRQPTSPTIDTRFTLMSLLMAEVRPSDM